MEKVNMSRIIGPTLSCLYKKHFPIKFMTCSFLGLFLNISDYMKFDIFMHTQTNIHTQSHTHTNTETDTSHHTHTNTQTLTPTYTHTYEVFLFHTTHIDIFLFAQGHK